MMITEKEFIALINYIASTERRDNEDWVPVEAMPSENGMVVLTDIPTNDWAKEQVLYMRVNG